MLKSGDRGLREFFTSRLDQERILAVLYAGDDQLARRYRLSAYDASYLELALRQGIAIATLDDDLQKAAKKAGVKKFE